jgi:hypothetical protein
LATSRHCDFFDYEFQHLGEHIVPARQAIAKFCHMVDKTQIGNPEGCSFVMQNIAQFLADYQMIE